LRERWNVFEIIIAILGIVVSALYVGYLAYAIGAVPLWVIVVLTYALIIREFRIEFWKKDNRNNNGGRSS
jgi:uncharacterized membrane protein YoaK (UPF0700 family)